MKQFYTSEIKKSISYLQIGQLEVHEDLLLSELHVLAFDQLKIYEAGDPMEAAEIQCELISLVSSSHSSVLDSPSII